MYSSGPPSVPQHVNYYYHHPHLSGPPTPDQYSTQSAGSHHHHHLHHHHQAIPPASSWKTSTNSLSPTGTPLHHVGHWDSPSMPGSGPVTNSQVMVHSHGDSGPILYDSDAFPQAPVIYAPVEHRDVYATMPHCAEDKQYVSRAAAEMLLSLKQINFPDHDPRQYYNQNSQYEHTHVHRSMDHGDYPAVHQPVSVNFQMTMSCISGVTSVPPPYSRPSAPAILQSSPAKNTTVSHDHYRQKRHLPPQQPSTSSHTRSHNDYVLAGHGDKVNICGTCRKSYARPSTLKTHMRTHSGEKPYRCGLCPKTFTQAANLTAHMRTHSGEKPFRCGVCDRRFSQSSSVTTHMRTHSGERPYRCRVCKKAFSDSSTLTKHVRIHSGEKPYQCQLCLLRFSQSGNLNRHMKVHLAERGG